MRDLHKPEKSCPLHNSQRPATHSHNPIAHHTKRQTRFSWAVKGKFDHLQLSMGLELSQGQVRTPALFSMALLYPTIIDWKIRVSAVHIFLGQYQVSEWAFRQKCVPDFPIMVGFFTFFPHFAYPTTATEKGHWHNNLIWPYKKSFVAISLLREKGERDYSFPIAKTREVGCDLQISL